MGGEGGGDTRWDIPVSPTFLPCAHSCCRPCLPIFILRSLCWSIGSIFHPSHVPAPPGPPPRGRYPHPVVPGGLGWGSGSSQGLGSHGGAWGRVPSGITSAPGLCTGPQHSDLDPLGKPKNLNLFWKEIPLCPGPYAFPSSAGSIAGGLVSIRGGMSAPGFVLHKQLGFHFPRSGAGEGSRGHRQGDTASPGQLSAAVWGHGAGDEPLRGVSPHCWCSGVNSTAARGGRGGWRCDQTRGSQPHGVWVRAVVQPQLDRGGPAGPLPFQLGLCSPRIPPRHS